MPVGHARFAATKDHGTIVGMNARGIGAGFSELLGAAVAVNSRERLIDVEHLLGGANKDPLRCFVENGL